MNAHETQTYFLPAGLVLTVTATATGTGTAIRLSRVPGGGDPQSITAIAGATLYFGPYISTERFKIISTVGTITPTMSLPSIDTDGTFAANSDNRYSSQKAIKTLNDALIASADALVYQGVISSLATFPAADKGDLYKCTAAGSIGGTGPVVNVGDIVICNTDSTGAGDYATVGTKWDIVQANLIDADVADAVTKKHTQGTDVALGAVSAKNPPVDADKTLYRDSAAADALVTSTWTQIKAFLKTYFDTLYNLYVHPNHSGAVTSVADGATTITNKAVTLPKLADMATASLLGRNTAAVGVPEVLSKATALSLLNVADGANAYVHPNHSGDVTSVADGAQTIATNAVTNAKAAQMATKTYKGRTTAATGNSEDVPVATVKVDLALVKADVGLGNVDNTADTAKPVSTAQQTALNLKAPLASPTFTGTVSAANITPTILAITEKTPVNAVAATGTLTVTGASPQIANNDTVTIDVKVYTYKTTLTPTEGEVLLGASDTAALLNLLNAINHTGTPDTDYAVAAVHPTVTGTSSDATTLVVTAKTKGVSTIATTETGASIAWGVATLAGGVDGTVGVANETCADATYLYHCLITNTVADVNWRRVALGSSY